MIPLILTAELDEYWSDDVGMTQTIVVKLSGYEVAKFKPHTYIHSSAHRGDIEYSVARWLERNLAA